MEEDKEVGGFGVGYGAACLSCDQMERIDSRDVGNGWRVVVLKRESDRIVGHLGRGGRGTENLWRT